MFVMHTEIPDVVIIKRYYFDKMIKKEVKEKMKHNLSLLTLSFEPDKYFRQIFAVFFV